MKTPDEMMGTSTSVTLEAGVLIGAATGGDEVPFLDRLMDLRQFCKWSGLSEQEVLKKVRQGVIPCINWGERSKRFHPRSVVDQAVAGAK